MEPHEFITDTHIELLNNNSHDDKWWLVYGLGTNQLKGVSLDSYKDVARKLTTQTLNAILSTSTDKDSDIYNLFYDELESRK